MVVLAGYGARISIKAGNLLIKHGRSYSTEDCPSEVLYKGIHGVSSLLWLVNGGAGSLSTQSLKWLAGQNITVRFITTKASIWEPSTQQPMHLGRLAFQANQTVNQIYGYAGHSTLARRLVKIYRLPEPLFYANWLPSVLV